MAKIRLIVYRINDEEYSVLELNRQYVVRWTGYKWICSCSAYSKNGEDIHYACRHIRAVFEGSTTKLWNEEGIEVQIPVKAKMEG